jgi:hypothetical protein
VPKLVRLLTALGLLALLLCPASADTAFAQAAGAGGCRFSINNFDVTGFSSSSHALEVDASSPLAVAIVYPRVVGEVTAEVDVGPVVRSYQVRQTDKTSNADWNGILDLSSQRSRAVGLQRIVFSTSGGCQSVTWVKLTGRSPFTTAFGVAATILFLGGIAGMVWSIRRAAAGKHGLIPSLIAAVAVGSAFATFAQEFSYYPLSTQWVVLWMALPVSIAAFASFGLSRRWAQAHPEDDDDDDDYDITDARFTSDDASSNPPPSAEAPS